jgi:hypothetical protein
MPEAPEPFDCEKGAQDYMAEIGDSLRPDLTGPEYVTITLKLSALLRQAHGKGMQSAIHPLLVELMKKKEGL